MASRRSEIDSAEIGIFEASISDTEGVDKVESFSIGFVHRSYLLRGWGECQSDR